VNALKRFRRLRAVPDEPATKPNRHAANRESVAALVASAGTEWAAPIGVLKVIEPDPEPVPVAAPDDPTPIFDAVLNTMPLDTAFEVAFILDELHDGDDLEEMVAAREVWRAEIRRDVVADVDFGWTA
jgi:hypothetical protein